MESEMQGPTGPAGEYLRLCVTFGGGDVFMTANTAPRTVTQHTIVWGRKGVVVKFFDYIDSAYTLP